MTSITKLLNNKHRLIDTLNLNEIVSTGIGIIFREYVLKFDATDPVYSTISQEQFCTFLLTIEHLFCNQSLTDDISLHYKQKFISEVIKAIAKLRHDYMQQKIPDEIIENFVSRYLLISNILERSHYTEEDDLLYILYIPGKIEKPLSEGLIWGPAYWVFLHVLIYVVSRKMKDTADLEQLSLLYTSTAFLLLKIDYFVPCAICASECRMKKIGSTLDVAFFTYYQTLTLSRYHRQTIDVSYVSVLDDLLFYVHNLINISLRKPILTDVPNYISKISKLVKDIL